MKVYVVTVYRRSEIWFSSEVSEDWPTEYRVAEVFENAADAEAFRAEKRGDGGEYRIHAKEVSHGQKSSE